jgi:hypothetical protein
MNKTRLHLILESAFHLNGRWWGLYPAAFPIRLKNRYMKHMMDLPTNIHFQLVCYGSHTLHDFKWTNPFGEKLAIRFAMLQFEVLRTQQHIVTNFVDLHRKKVVVQVISRGVPAAAIRV